MANDVRRLERKAKAAATSHATKAAIRVGRVSGAARSRRDGDDKTISGSNYVISLVGDFGRTVFVGVFPEDGTARLITVISAPN